MKGLNECIVIFISKRQSLFEVMYIHVKITFVKHEIYTDSVIISFVHLCLQAAKYTQSRKIQTLIISNARFSYFIDSTGSIRRCFAETHRRTEREFRSTDTEGSFFRYVFTRANGGNIMLIPNFKLNSTEKFCKANGQSAALPGWTDWFFFQQKQREKQYWWNFENIQERWKKGMKKEGRTRREWNFQYPPHWGINRQKYTGDSTEILFAFSRDILLEKEGDI